jgi:hypothetical protein
MKPAWKDLAENEGCGITMLLPRSPRRGELRLLADERTMSPIDTPLQLVASWIEPRCWSFCSVPAMLKMDGTWIDGRKEPAGDVAHHAMSGIDEQE